jgi:hypothetical protein
MMNDFSIFKKEEKINLAQYEKINEEKLKLICLANFWKVFFIKIIFK